MVTLTESICWKEVVKATDVTGIGVVIYQKPTSSSCYEERKDINPPLCIHKSVPTISWYTPLKGCLPPIHIANFDTQQGWRTSWPERLKIWPSNLFETNREYSEERYNEDTRHWEVLVSGIYMHNLAINWSSIRNVIDMNASFGGFAAVLVKEPLWVMNVVPIHGPDSLPVIFKRGLIGIYHDWCESFNTYPRTYDLMHSSFLFDNLKKRCNLVDVVVEMDRIVRPGGWVLIQDTIEMIEKLSFILHSLHWDTSIHRDMFLVGKKGFWRP